MPRGVEVRYVDRVPRATAIHAHRRELEVSRIDVSAIREPDIIDDAETLRSLANASVDFVIANHVLEHLEDPIAALTAFARVLRPSGVVFLTLPDARYSFDSPRERTTVEHLMRDHDVGPETTRFDHYAEWARYIDGTSEKDVDDRVAAYARDDARHHFHVWELDGFLELIRRLDLPFYLELGQCGVEEFAVVLRRL